MTETNEQKLHTCAKCGAQTEEQQAIANEYKCPQCDYELAHLDIAANGSVRGIFDWLKEKQTQIGGRYLVETVLGKGGFGATYLVTDQRVHGKRWALKEIPEMLFDEYEVSLLSQLDHPSVPIIVDRFVDQGMVYLVLKFGGTRTLATECKQTQKIPYAKLKPWILQIANVLDYLHSRNPPIIHRDLKPENILIDDENRIMLIDFGIAKESIAASVTRTLGRAASHGFSPPEQVMGTGTDIRSDIYSFAATIYYALIGKTPTAAHERVAGAVLQTPSELVSGIPEEVNAMLMKALSLNINERPQSITDFLIPFTGNDNPSNDKLDNSKTIQISDIQFGPIVREGVTHSTPLGQHSQSSPHQPNNKTKIVGATVVAVMMSAGGLYWFMSGSPSNEASTPPANTQIEAISEPQPFMPPEHGTPINASVTPPPSSANTSNGPSALDILKDSLGPVETVKEEPATTKPLANTSIKKETATKPAKEDNVKKEAVAQPKKEPDWSNQQQGSF